MTRLPVYIFVLLALTVSSFAQARERLTAAALTDWEPYSDEHLPNYGFDNDLLIEAMERAGYDVKIVMLPWSRALQGATDGEYDILPSIWYTPERAEKLVYSKPFATNRLRFVKPIGSNFDYRKLEDLKGMHVGTLNAYAYPIEFLNSALFFREPVSTLVQNLKKLAMGRIDVAVDDELTLKYVLNTKASDIADKLSFAKGVLSENQLYVGFAKKRKDAAELASAFNRGVAAMRMDGSYEALLKKHHMK
jgi:polar amino acid transport system substrate-binding protein